jgi:hypothetical protein
MMTGERLIDTPTPSGPETVLSIYAIRRVLFPWALAEERGACRPGA